MGGSPDPQAASPNFASPNGATNARGRRGGDRQDVVIGFVGRLESYKGADLLMRAFTKVPRELPVRLRVAGTDRITSQGIRQGRLSYVPTVSAVTSHPRFGNAPTAAAALSSARASVPVCLLEPLPCRHPDAGTGVAARRDVDPGRANGP